jgi:hypothetical protein
VGWDCPRNSSIISGGRFPTPSLCGGQLGVGTLVSSDPWMPWNCERSWIVHPVRGMQMFGGRDILMCRPSGRHETQQPLALI